MLPIKRKSTWENKIKVQLGDRLFSWPFHVADVGQPIMGADFLVANNLAIDLRGRRLIDLSSYKTIPARSVVTSTASGIQEVRSGDTELAAIIEEFPDVLVPRFKPSDETNTVLNITCQLKVLPFLHEQGV